jgi:hypothetical protein
MQRSATSGLGSPAHSSKNTQKGIDSCNVAFRVAYSYVGQVKVRLGPRRIDPDGNPIEKLLDMAVESNGDVYIVRAIPLCQSAPPNRPLIAKKTP